MAMAQLVSREDLITFINLSHSEVAMFRNLRPVLSWSGDRVNQLMAAIDAELRVSNLGKRRRSRGAPDPEPVENDDESDSLIVFSCLKFIFCFQRAPAQDPETPVS